MKWMIGSIAVVLSVVAIGCKDTGSGADKPATQPLASLPPGFILSEQPADALDVATAKQKLAAGDQIVVQGRIGGRVEPFVAERAIFQLVDTSIPTCIDKHGDGCPTPWDYCCEPKDQVAAKSLTVQVVDGEGKPLRTSIKGTGGLDPMANVVIRGKVDQKDEHSMVIRADGIYVQPPQVAG